MFDAGGGCATRFKGFGRTLQGDWVEGKLKDQLKEREVVIMYKMAVLIVIGLAVVGQAMRRGRSLSSIRMGPSKRGMILT